MTSIIVVQNVRGYCDANGTAWLNVEDIARELGFTEKAASGNVTIRWRTVRNYLESFGYEPIAGSCDDVKAGDYIPENMVYRLAMKANNETAQNFQAKIANEILPAIRKHGVYATDKFLEMSLADPAWAIGVLQAFKAEREKNAVLETQIAELKPKASYYDVVLNCKDLVSVSKIAKDYGMSAIAFNRLIHELGVQFKQGNIWLLYQKYAVLGWTSTKTQTFTGSDGSVYSKVHTYWTQKGRLGLYDLLKQHDYLPLIERNVA